MKIGFVGTGTMGQPMLSNLLKKGHGVVAYDVVAAMLDGAVGRGASRAGSAAEAAKQSELVITMLPSSSHVETAYLGGGGILEGARVYNDIMREKLKARLGRDIFDETNKSESKK